MTFYVTFITNISKNSNYANWKFIESIYNTKFKLPTYALHENIFITEFSGKPPFTHTTSHTHNSPYRLISLLVNTSPSYMFLYPNFPFAFFFLSFFLCCYVLLLNSITMCHSRNIPFFRLTTSASYYHLEAINARWKEKHIVHLTMMM